MTSLLCHVTGKFKYNMEIYDEIMNSFDTLPISALINVFMAVFPRREKFLCLHGGLSPDVKTVPRLIFIFVTISVMVTSGTFYVSLIFFSSLKLKVLTGSWKFLVQEQCGTLSLHCGHIIYSVTDKLCISTLSVIVLQIRFVYLPC